MVFSGLSLGKLLNFCSAPNSHRTGKHCLKASAVVTAPIHSQLHLLQQSMRQAAETSEAAFASIAFCAWLSARATWASKVLSFIGNNGWESALTLRFWMGLGPFLTYLSMLANNEWPSLPILARIQLSTAGLEFVEGRGRNKRVLSYLESKKATTKWLRHHTSLYVAEWGQLQFWVLVLWVHKRDTLDSLDPLEFSYFALDSWGFEPHLAVLAKHLRDLAWVYSGLHST